MVMAKVLNSTLRILLAITFVMSPQFALASSLEIEHQMYYKTHPEAHRPGAFYFDEIDIELLGLLHGEFQSRIGGANKVMGDIQLDWTGYFNSRLKPNRMKFPYSLDPTTETYLNYLKNSVNAAFSAMKINLFLSQKQLVTSTPDLAGAKVYETDPNADIDMDDLSYSLANTERVHFLYYKKDNQINTRFFQSEALQHKYKTLTNESRKKLAKLEPLTHEEMLVAINLTDQIGRIALRCFMQYQDGCLIRSKVDVKAMTARLQRLRLEDTESARRDIAWSSHAYRHQKRMYVAEFIKKAQDIVFKTQYESLMRSFPIIGYMSRAIPQDQRAADSKELRYALSMILQNNIKITTDLQTHFDNKDYEALLVLVSLANVKDSVIERTQKMDEELSKKYQKSAHKLFSHYKSMQLKMDLYRVAAYIGTGIVCGILIPGPLGILTCGIVLGGAMTAQSFSISQGLYDKDFGYFFASDDSFTGLSDLSELNEKQTRMKWEYFSVVASPVVPSLFKLLKSSPPMKVVINGEVHEIK